MAIKSIAVLPFKPLRSDGNDEYLGLGIADVLITKLSGMKQFIVRPTSVVRKYVNSEIDPLVAGREQQVEAVLDSNLQREGEHIRVTVRLLDVRNGIAIWIYQCVERSNTDSFTLQDSIAQKVAKALAVKLSGEERN